MNKIENVNNKYLKRTDIERNSKLSYREKLVINKIEIKDKFSEEVIDSNHYCYLNKANTSSPNKA